MGKAVLRMTLLEHVVTRSLILPPLLNLMHAKRNGPNLSESVNIIPQVQ